MQIIWTEKIATCHTEGCSNAEIPLEVTVGPDTPVYCGVCGNLITDVQPIVEEAPVKTTTKSK